MIRPSSRFSAPFVVASLVAALASCASRETRGPRFVTAAELPQGGRRPDGVVVDPSPELPRAAEAAVPASDLVVLKPPLPETAARSVVAAFFRAIVTEDLEALTDLATPDASAPSRTRGNGGSIVEHWRSRMRHFRYRTLANEVLYQEADIELYRYEDLETIAPRRPVRPPDMTRSDLVLRVPMAVVRLGADRAFGDDLQFLLRRDKDRYRIRQVLEDFQFP
jgi:hypothetical protein